MRENRSENLLEVLLTHEERHDDESEANKGVVIGKLVNFTPSGEPLVIFPSNPSDSSLAAKTTVVLALKDIGRHLVVVFEEGNPLRPIVLGIIQSAAQPDRKVSGLTGSQSSFVGVVESDGERIVFEAEREIVLRCGEASITLTRAGKILLRGKYLLSRSSGVNRIKGGSVQIN